MTQLFSRRHFLHLAGVAGTGLMLTGRRGSLAATPVEPPFRISLAEWSVHRMIFDEALLTNLQFPAFARSLGFEAVEFVNTCFFDKASSPAYLTELRSICRQEGIKSLLIMCDNEGMVGHPDHRERLQTLENHKKWIDAAAYLGCHSVRVNAGSTGSYEEQQKLASDGLHLLCEYGDTAGIHILVENHGGLSSNADWLAGVMQLTAHKRLGTLPDFGNFRISETETFDPYRGMEILMPWARGVSAKSHDFDDQGGETATDYPRMLRIVLDSGFNGYIGVEYEGTRLPEKEGILATRMLLEKCATAFTTPAGKG